MVVLHRSGSSEGIPGAFPRLVVQALERQFPKTEILFRPEVGARDLKLEETWNPRPGVLTVVCREFDPDCNCWIWLFDQTGNLFLLQIAKEKRRWNRDREIVALSVVNSVSKIPGCLIMLAGDVKCRRDDTYYLSGMPARYKLILGSRRHRLEILVEDGCLSTRFF